jgi:hypothetical protein
MSLYELATASARAAEPVLVIKEESAADPGGQRNIAVYSSSSSITSVTIPSRATSDAEFADGSPTAPAIINLQAPEVKSALTKIARFIPTETVTIYLGAVSASVALQSSLSWLTPKVVYWTCAFLITPFIFFLMVAIERAREKKSLLASFPIWKLSAAILGFLIWALAVPGNPYVTSDIAKVTAAFLALATSIFLDLIDQLFEARKQAARSV